MAFRIVVITRGAAPAAAAATGLVAIPPNKGYSSINEMARKAAADELIKVETEGAAEGRAEKEYAIARRDVNARIARPCPEVIAVKEELEALIAAELCEEKAAEEAAELARREEERRGRVRAARSSRREEAACARDQLAEFLCRFNAAEELFELARVSEAVLLEYNGRCKEECAREQAASDLAFLRRANMGW
jgi:hypothetical protein